MRSMSRSRRTALAAVALFVPLAGCEREQVVTPGGQGHAPHERAGPATVANADVVEIIARHEGDEYVFDILEAGQRTDEVPSGWTTFELANHSGATHFVYLAQVPEAAIEAAGADGEAVLDYWYEHVTRPFQWYMDFLDPGKDPDSEDLSGKYTDGEEIFPPWFGGAVPMGGPGFTQGWETSRTTVDLEPGVYIVECYVKDGDGVFHSYRGMLSLLTVTEEDSGANEPRASMTVDLSTGEIDADEAVRPGLHTVEVRWQEQAVYPHLLGHDVHLLRLDDGTVEEAAEWMDWTDPEGLVSASGDRGPATFLGGAQAMTEGSTAYFTVDLKPGEYAWIAEVPAAERMWRTFRVPGPGQGAGAAGGR